MDEADRSCGRGIDPQGIQVQDGHSARYSSLQVNDRPRLAEQHDCIIMYTYGIVLNEHLCHSAQKINS